MTDYTKLIKALRHCGKGGDVSERCLPCDYYDREPWCEAALVNDAADALEAAEKRVARLEEDLKTREAEREVMQDTIKICEEAADRYKAQLPKQGEWRPIQIGRWHECTCCRITREVPCSNNGIPQWSYCPDCGAKMEVQE